jgi:hypothetical protein
MAIRRFIAERLSRRTLLSSVFVSTLILGLIPLSAHAGIVEQVATAGYSAVFGVLGFLSYFILLIASMLLGLAGVLFNWTVTVTIFQFGQILGNSEGMLAAWGVMRDVGNIILLFGFIFMGLLVILDAHHYPVKKTLPAFIIFAVLLNFSLFFTEFVIDASNAVASAVYMESGVCPQDATREECATSTQYGISGKVLEMAGISGIFGVDIGLMTQGTVTIGLALMVTITAVVLLAASIMLLIRCIILAFLMVTSPIAFVGFAIPQLNGLARDWWDKLISQSFFAPAFLLLILVSLKLMEGIRQALGTVDNRSHKNLGAAFSETGQGEPTILLSFALMIGFMVASLIVARKMGAIGAGFATNVASSTVFGAVTRGTNLGAGALGAGLSRASRIGLKDGQTPGWVRSGATRVGMQLKGANLDMRRAPGMSGVLGAAGITAGAKPAEHATYNDLEHMLQDAKEGKARKQFFAEGANDIKRRKLEDEAHHAGPGGDISDESKAEFAGMSVKQLEALHGIKSGIAALAKNLSPEQFEGLMKSDKLDDSQKAALKEGRYEDLSTKLTQAADMSLTAAARTAAENDSKKMLSRMGKKDLENLPAALLANSTLLSQLSEKQREDLSGSDKRTASERDAIKNAGPAAQLEIIFRDPSLGGPAAAAARIPTLSIPQVAKLDVAILKDPLIAEQLTPAMLIELQEQKKLKAGEITAIASHIKSSRTAKGRAHVTGVGGVYWS